MDGRRYADEPEPQWYGDRDWRTPAADAAEADPRAATRPRRASDPLTDPTGYSDHWNTPRTPTPETPDVPAQPDARSRRGYAGGYEYDAVTGRGLEALPVVTPATAAPEPVAEPAVPDASRTAAYPLTGDIPKFRTEALDRAALRRPPADPSAAARPDAAAPDPAPAAVHPPAAPAFIPPAGEPPYGVPAEPPYGVPAEPPFGPPVEPPFSPAAGGHPGQEPAFGPGGERVYTTRRPILAVPIGLVAVLLEIPALRLLLDGFTGGTAAAGNLVSGLALALSLPLTGFGLYALLTTGRAADHRTWWRPPLAYLPLGLILLIAAAVAAR
ncbi:hypothetical protein [Catenuloplanes atrovinosus]|uniref:Uncharacterized protein n=1 Tax=Catenuloplanes atrovinosus TaxID=137266 RepID=A0AAE3YJ64_9ACTN|nr:hypothetical protein [Catenuloplanes atrovinosus]MDR7273339.1 hypothetical protein [Catenuloplanes atrovinosus]